eukprot:scaffold94181_cov59-Phaeocystis_antarctica.AAC.12
MRHVFPGTCALLQGRKVSGGFVSALVEARRPLPHRRRLQVGRGRRRVEHQHTRAALGGVKADAGGAEVATYRANSGDPRRVRHPRRPIITELAGSLAKQLAVVRFRQQQLAAQPPRPTADEVDARGWRDPQATRGPLAVRAASRVGRRVGACRRPAERRRRGQRGTWLARGGVAPRDVGE